MQEFYVQQDMFSPQGQSERRTHEEVEQPKARRRVESLPVEQTFDFSKVDFTRKDVRASLGRAYRVLLSSPRRLQSSEEKEA